MLLDAFLRGCVKFLLWLRYRIRVRGLAEVAARGTRGILFLPNHPALIDPIIVMSVLHRDFRPRPLADKDQVSRPGLGWLMRRIRVRPIPDLVAHGPAAREEIEAVIADCVAGLRRGENLVLYPAGHLYRTRYEHLYGNSAVERILREAPDCRVVLIRTTGLWGSAFSMAGGTMPTLGQVLRRGGLAILKNFIFFTPRRDVTLTLSEPADLPRQAGRNELNAYLERFYNAEAPPNTYVPCTIWERGGPREMPEPQPHAAAGDLTSVPESTRQLVYGFLREKSGLDAVRDDQHLAHDLGMDSLARTELVVWLGKEFGFATGDVDSIRTVGDALLAARGEAVSRGVQELRPPPPAWLRARGDARVAIAAGDRITSIFLAEARRGPDRMVIADQTAGAKTYRDLILAILVLRPEIESLPGERVGVMLPASVGASIVYLAALFAGKSPVMINWTTGARNLRHALELTGVQHVLTSQLLVARVEAQGVDLSVLRERMVFLESLRENIGPGRKLLAWLMSRLNWSSLDRASVSETAAILLTSGSENVPKAAPLTHANILASVRDILSAVSVRESDSLLAFLPPFHSFGLTVTTVLPLLCGLRTVYHPNPTDAFVLARLVEAYGLTVVVGTPTFLAGMARVATGGQLSSLRLAVTGAEACPERTYQLLAERCPNAVVLEGYGVTECAPIISANREEHPVRGSIGQVMPSVEYAIVDLERDRRVPPGEQGMLLVRGPNVFGGYLGRDVASPFVEFEGRRWYRTGDLVCERDGVLFFRGRLKRFVKLGGEMVSLPAIEAVLEQRALEGSPSAAAPGGRDGPVLAVEAADAETNPELVLFTTLPLDRATVNGWIRSSGLSPLHNITRVERVEHIPVLGTGKTDYRALRALLAEKVAAPAAGAPSG